MGVACEWESSDYNLDINTHLNVLLLVCAYLYMSGSNSSHFWEEVLR